MKNATKETMKALGSLKRRADFLSVQNAGRKWVSPGVIVMAAPASEGEVRFGLTVTKKLSKSAVVRNRIRRRLRAAAYDVLPERGQKGTDYVLIARPESVNIDYDKLCSDLRWCLKRLS